MFELRPYQIDDLAFIIRNKRAGLLHDPGCGKTPPVCLWFWWLWNELKTRGVWVMPKSLLDKNRKELLAFTKFKEEDLAILEEPPIALKIIRLLDAARNGELFLSTDGSYMQRVHRKKPKRVNKPLVTGLIEKRLVELVNGRLEITPAGESVNLDPLLRLPQKVVLMGFDYFAEHWLWIAKNNPDMTALAVDEIHLGFSHNSAKRTQSFYKALERHFDRFVPMTGTLIDGRLDTAYPTIHAIEPRYYASYMSFLAEHQVTDFFGTLIGWQNHDKIAQILSRHCRRMSFAQVYGEEAKVILKEQVPMDLLQREAYDKFEKEAVLELEDKFLDGTLPGVHAIRCRQIMQCPELHGIKLSGPTGKDERIAIHLGDAAKSGKPLVIFATFLPEMDRLVELSKSMGLKTELINSTVSREKRSQIDADFQAGKFQVLVASPQTAGIGFNWGHVDEMVFSSLDYKDSSFIQAYRRAIRGVRHKPLRIYVLEYENSIDQRIFQIVDKKTLDAKRVDETREVFNLSAVTSAG